MLFRWQAFVPSNEIFTHTSPSITHMFSACSSHAASGKDRRRRAVAAAGAPVADTYSACAAACYGDCISM